MSDQDIRWKQRFENYQKAFGHLEQALEIPKPDLVQKAGLVQFFEMSFELAWKTMKDFLEEEGYTDLRSPRAAIKQAFETGLIEDGHTWLEGLHDRNQTAHTYDEAALNQVIAHIRTAYHPLLKRLVQTLHHKAYG